MTETTTPQQPSTADRDWYTADSPLPATPATERPAWRLRAGAAAAVVVLCLGSGTAGAVLASRDAVATGTVTESAAHGLTIAASVSSASRLAQVAAAVQPSVVSIGVSSRQGSGPAPASCCAPTG